MKGSKHNVLLLLVCFFIATACAGKNKLIFPLFISSNSLKSSKKAVTSLKAGGGVTLLLDTDLGNYSVLVDSKVWFQSGVTALHTSEGWFAANVKSKSVNGECQNRSNVSLN